jgi:hypothetical protein
MPKGEDYPVSIFYCELDKFNFNIFNLKTEMAKKPAKKEAAPQEKKRQYKKKPKPKKAP